MPYDWLTGEEVSPEELDYREQLRQSVTSGEINAVPLNDGNWQFDNPPLPEQGGTYQSQSTPSSPTSLTTLHPLTPLDTTPTKSSVDAAQQMKDATARSQELDQKYSATPGFVDPGYDVKATQDFQSLSDDWQEFERNLDTSYPGMTEDEIDLQLKGEKLNSASKSIIQNTAPPEGVFDPNTPFKQSTPLDPIGSLVKDVADAVVYARNKTYIPYVTPFIEKEVVPAVAESVKDTLTGDYFATGGDLSKDAKSPISDRLDDNGFGRAYLKVAEAAGSLASSFVPTHGVDFALELAPGIGDARGLYVANKEARNVAVQAGATRIALAETIGENGLSADLRRFRLGDKADSLATRNLRRSSDDILAESMVRADPKLTKDEALTFINQERMASRMLYAASDNVAKLAGDEIVTVYHATDAASAENIRRVGFKQGAFVTVDPDAAAMHAIEKRGVESPVILKWEVPRKQLTQSKANPIVFTANSTWKLDPTFQQASGGMTDAINSVRDWLKQGLGGQTLGGERGSFRLPGGQADDVPDDVARLAFGDSPVEDMSPDAVRAREKIKAATEFIGDTEKPDFFANLPDKADPDYERQLRNATMQEHAWDSNNTPAWRQNMSSIDRELEKGFKELRAMDNSSLNAEYKYSIDRASYWQDEIERFETLRSRNADAGTSRLVQNAFDQIGQTADNYDSGAYSGQINAARQNLYVHIAETQRYGEELFRRTNGAEGMPEKISSSIKKMLGNMNDETGAFIWGVGPIAPKNPNVFPAAYGAANASKLPWGMQVALDTSESMVPKVFNLQPGDKPGFARKVAGGIIHGFTMPRVVLVANRARSAVESRVSEFTRPLANAARTLEQEFLANPPKLKLEVEYEKQMAQYQQRLNMYNQHVAASAAKKLPTVMVMPVPPKPPVLPNGSKTIVDYLEHWWEYDETVSGLANAKLIKARAAWDDAADGALVTLHDQFGISVEPVYPRGPMGERGSYVPHMESIDEIARKKEANELGASRGMRSTAKADLEKPRLIDTIRQRMVLDPDFVPETELHTIATRYGAQMADSAGKHTYDTLLGGKTLMQIFEEKNPKVIAMRKAAESRVVNTRNSLRNVAARLREAGIDQKAINREIEYVRKRESKAAARVEAAGDKGLERVTKLQEDLDELKIQAKAYDRIVARVQTQLTDKNARFTAVEDARKTLASLQQTAIEKLDNNLQGQAAQKQVLGAAPTTSPLRIKNNILELKGRLRGLEAFDKRLGSMSGAAGNRIEFLQNKIDELEKLGRGITDSELAQLAEGLKKAETASIKDAMVGIGAQKELGVTGTRLNNKLKRATENLNKRVQDMADKQTKLANEMNGLGQIREAVSVGKDAAKKNYALDPVTNKYVPVDVQRASAAISSTKQYGLLKMLEEGRAVQLSTGDFSPLVYGRAQMGLFGYLGMAPKIPMIIAKGITSGEVWDGVDQSMLQTFQMLRGRSVTKPMAEIRPDDRLVGVERIPGIGKPIRAINDTLNDIATFGEYSAWETSVRAKLRTHPNTTLVQAGAEVMKAMENIAPRVDFEKLGFSPATARVLNVPFTSLSYMASTPQFTVSYSRAWGKLAGEVAKNKFNPLAAWRALGIADQETIIHGTEMLSTISMLSAATAVLWGDESIPVEDRVLDAMNPAGKDGWQINLPGGGSIPLAVPLRSGIRASVAGMKGVVGGLGGPTGALDAVSPGVQGDFLAPANYVANRLISIPSWAYHMAFNKDFRGDQIITKEGWGAVSQAVLYGLENATIVTSPAVHAVRTGEVGNARETVGDVTKGWGLDVKRDGIGVSGSVSVPQGVQNIASEMIESQMGLNVYDPSVAQQWKVFQKRSVDEMLKDGTVPPDMQEYFANTDIDEMPSSFRKLIEDHIKENHPDNYDWYIKGRRADKNVFQETADKIQQVEEKYAKEKFDPLFEKLLNGDNPYSVWNAYDTAKNELRGAKDTFYNDKEYNKKIESLDIGDMRKLEDAWNAITDQVYKENAGALDDEDYSKLAQKQAEFLTDLRARDPDTYKVFNYHLDLQEQRSYENAHPMEQLRRDARDLLAPYYLIPKEDTAARGDWLEKNPEADFMKWMTAKTEDPGLNSIAAIEKAYAALPERPVHLAQSNQNVTDKNLPIFKKYDKEITRLLALPTEDVYNGKPYNPRQELMEQSPLYEALWFWLGMVKPAKTDEDSAVSLFHPEEVLQYSRLWGGRTDKVNVKRK